MWLNLYTYLVSYLTAIRNKLVEEMVLGELGRRRSLVKVGCAREGIGILRIQRAFSLPRIPFEGCGSEED